MAGGRFTERIECGIERVLDLQARISKHRTEEPMAIPHARNSAVRLALPPICVLLAAKLAAAPEPLWRIGTDDDPFSSNYSPTAEFATESYSGNPAPGAVTRLPDDPLYNEASNPARDDDFYQAGTYPAGFNGIAGAPWSVPYPEPSNAFERVVASNDPANRVHFILPAAAAGTQARLRLTFEIVNGGTWSQSSGSGEGFGSHDLRVRWINSNGATTILQRNGLDRDTRFTLDIPAASVQALAGPNTIEFSRTGPAAPPDSSAWISFDFIQLEVDADALADGDGDGLPRWWEADNGLDDANASDATVDSDQDGLLPPAEYNGGIASTHPRRADTDGDGSDDAAERAAGCNPLLADSDGDGLADGAELAATPASSPLLADTDADGAPDAWEKRTGSDPASAASVPVAFTAAIGINFVALDSPDGRVASNHPAGRIPQIHWNNTTPLRSWSRPSGSHADIATPVAGAIVNGGGAVVPGLSLAWTSDSAGGSYNSGSAERQLMDGFLRASSSTPATVTLQGIPFASYHVFAYVGGGYDGQRASVAIAGDAASARPFRTYSAAPQDRWVEIKASAAIPEPYANLAHYPARSGPDLTIETVNVDGWSVGIHALQIVDANADNDGSGIPDWYEILHGLQPANAATAGTDPDGDTLTNSQEFTRGSNPRLRDTDGDGLADNEEPPARALSVDSDGDGMSDHDEVNAPLPSDPGLADSDGDGLADRDERDRGLDPATAPAPGFAGWMPVYTASPAAWAWSVENAQLVWDHGEGAPNGADGTEDTLFGLRVYNNSAPTWRPLGLYLRAESGAVTYLFESSAEAMFSASGNPSSDLVFEDAAAPPADLKAALGFSGHGGHDISDRLRFRVSATRGGSNQWNVTFEISNQTRGTTVIARSAAVATAAANVDDGTALWNDGAGLTTFPGVILHEGLRLFITPTPLENLPAFAAHRDSDNDGMPDAWEETHLLNKNSAADANQDADGDGLKNRDEWSRGTNPRMTDSDGDGIDDRMESIEGSDPNDSASSPAYATANWPSGTDLNGNGFPDAWEIRHHATGMAPHADDDGDGADNSTEAAWGTDPRDAASRIAVGIERDGDDALLTWTHSPWKRQRLHRGTAPGQWQAMTTNAFTGDGWQLQRLAGEFPGHERAFFTVSTEDRDSDGDGVPDWDEQVIGSDPYRRDSARADAGIFGPGGEVTGAIAGDRAAFVLGLAGTLPGTATAAGITPAQAARFLQQATFGVTSREIEKVRQLGYEGWIDDQIHNAGLTSHRAYIESIYADLRGPRLDLGYDNDGGTSVGGGNTNTAFARAAVAGGDQLRQRVAFALSQILVTSRRDSNLQGRPLGMADYYDIFTRHAFGNYRDILGEVALHPAMGRYLSHIGNQKARPEINQYPDENFARELMQLFTIGLWELDDDGTRRLDAGGRPVPTYDNGDITGLARVFTGLWFRDKWWGSGGWTDEELSAPMEMFPEKHDFGQKNLLRGLVVPARPASAANGLADIGDALDSLFGHPNTPPFISRQLIQFLVTSNPTPAYVGRVSAVFRDNGAGRRGDLGAVVRAVLLDPEARDARWSHGSPSFGRLKDPVQRAMALARVGKLARHPRLLWWDYGNFQSDALQDPGNSPSVFNFYRPDYRPPGILTQNQLVGPAFQITNSYSSISFVNRLWENTTRGFSLWSLYSFPPDYSELLPLAADPEALADRVNLLFCGGMMSAATRDRILDALGQTPAADPLLRVQLAVFISATCPEGAIQR